MRILFKTSEKDRLKYMTLLSDDHIVEYDEEDSPIFIYKVENGELVLTKDVKEFNRSYSDEELKSFPMPTKEETRDWWVNTKADSTPYTEHQVYSRALMHHFKLISNSGYRAATGQYSFQIGCDQNISIEQHLEELNYFLPHIDEEEKEKCKCISIFEETLSENGDYWLHIFENSTFLLIKFVYRSVENAKEFKSLKSALEYIIKNHPYTRIRSSLV